MRKFMLLVLLFASENMFSANSLINPAVFLEQVRKNVYVEEIEWESFQDLHNFLAQESNGLFRGRVFRVVLAFNKAELFLCKNHNSPCIVYKSQHISLPNNVLECVHCPKHTFVEID